MIIPDMHHEQPRLDCEFPQAISPAFIAELEADQ